MARFWKLVGLLAISSAFALLAAAGGTTGEFEAKSRTWTVSVKGAPRFSYVFNPGGAICGIHDLAIAPSENLIGPSFQGETTDRVVQWTYWNGRYKVPRNEVGDGDRRANVTMEGSFAEAAVCDVLESPASGVTARLRFKSRIRHWFYANLDQHGPPDFRTESTYDLLPDGSLLLTRRVQRQPWRLRDVLEDTWDGFAWQATSRVRATMVCEHYWSRSQTSYFEAWSPFRGKVLPRQRSAAGEFDGDGYQFWSPEKLGGWAMAYGEKQAVALVFGKWTAGASKTKLAAVFNKLLQPAANLNILLPALEVTWPDGATLTQTLAIVPGSPEDVPARADALVDRIPQPQMDAPAAP